MLIGEFAVSGRLSMATVDDFFVVDEKERRQNEVFADQPNVTIVDADLGMDTKKLKNSGRSKKKVGSVKSIRSSILKSKNETLAEFEKTSFQQAPDASPNIKWDVSRMVENLLLYCRTPSFVW